MPCGTKHGCAPVAAQNRGCRGDILLLQVHKWCAIACPFAGTPAFCQDALLTGAPSDYAVLVTLEAVDLDHGVLTCMLIQPLFDMQARSSPQVIELHSHMKRWSSIQAMSTLRLRIPAVPMVCRMGAVLLCSAAHHAGIGRPEPSGLRASAISRPHLAARASGAPICS